MDSEPVLSAADEALALSIRAMLMLRQGVIEEACADWAQALAHPGVSAIDSDRLAELLRQAGSPEPWVFDTPLATWRALHDVFARAGRYDLWREFARGNYWAWRRAMAGHQWQSAWQAGLMVSVALASAWAGRRLP